jgi:glutathione S-transferase
MSSSSSLKPLILHAHSTGPNPYKVAIALEILSLPYTVKLWDFGDAPNGVKSSTFTKINPNGRVPALEDPNTGVTSWESGACLNYLVRTYDAAPKGKNVLGPKDTEESRVEHDQWVFFLVSTLGPMMGQVNWFRHYHPEKIEGALKRYEEQSYRCFGVLEEQLKRSGGKYIVGGDKPSVVDLHFYPWVCSYGFAGLSMDEYPKVKAWVEGLAGLEEVKRAYEKIPNGEKA